MPIITEISLGPNDPRVQADGRHRGTLTATLEDGRQKHRQLTTADSQSWDQALLDIEDQWEVEIQKQDAFDSLDPDQDIEPHLYATEQQRAVAYIQSALDEEVAFICWKKLDRFNSWRASNGWSVEQVRAVLTLPENGLTDDQLDDALARYSYLDAGDRPSSMQVAYDIQLAYEDL